MAVKAICILAVCLVFVCAQVSATPFSPRTAVNCFTCLTSGQDAKSVSQTEVCGSYRAANYQNGFLEGIPSNLKATCTEPFRKCCVTISSCFADCKLARPRCVADFRFCINAATIPAACAPVRSVATTVCDTTRCALSSNVG